jgi:hypothetical protein
MRPRGPSLGGPRKGSTRPSWGSTGAPRSYPARERVWRGITDRGAKGKGPVPVRHRPCRAPGEPCLSARTPDRHPQSGPLGPGAVRGWVLHGARQTLSRGRGGHPSGLLGNALATVGRPRPGTARGAGGARRAPNRRRCRHPSAGQPKAVLRIGLPRLRRGLPRAARSARLAAFKLQVLACRRLRFGWVYGTGAAARPRHLSPPRPAPAGSSWRQGCSSIT